MHGLVMQPWTTLKGSPSTTTLVQSDEDYLDLEAFEDYVAWIEVDEVSLGGASTASLWLETAPSRDAVWFAPLGGTQKKVALAVGVSTVRNILNAPGANQIPLARFLRWRLDFAGASSNWSVTFQIHIAAYASGSV